MSSSRLPFVHRMPATNPVLPVADMTLAIEFYRGLGFGVTSYDAGYAWVTHCGWEWLHLRRVDDVSGNAAGAYLHVDDADAWHAVMTRSPEHAPAVSAIAEMPWGKREFSVTDPSGNVVRVGQPSRCRSSTAEPT